MFFWWRVLRLFGPKIEFFVIGQIILILNLFDNFL